MAKANAKTSSGKFSFVNELQEAISKCAEVTRSGEIRIKRKNLKDAVENVFSKATTRAAQGERVKFPVIGTLVRKDVPERKAKKGVNPFTGEPMTIKARKASKKPRWSFPRSTKEVFANKRHW